MLDLAPARCVDLFVVLGVLGAAPCAPACLDTRPVDLDGKPDVGAVTELAEPDAAAWAPTASDATATPAGPEVAPSAEVAEPSASCPSAQIVFAPGDVVATNTAVLLDGSHSSAGSAGSITRYQWTLVAQPARSALVLEPTTSAAQVHFTPVFPGQYLVRLEAWDDQGHPACKPAEAELDVVGVENNGLTVVLTWHNPFDINESDTGDGLGADLDLHFLHPNANGKWKDSIFDVFFMNPRPNWGAFGVDDDPSLDRDDSDGRGPEILHYPDPIGGLQYRVGANYWNDWGYGPAFVTVRVFVHGELTFEWKDVSLTDGDMWEACTIDWPAGRVTPSVDAAGAPVILHGFAGENWL